LARHWQVVVAAMVGVGFGATGFAFYTLGLFVRPLSQAFGWSRGQISVAALCLQGGLIVTAPFVGLLVDRFGARTIALVSMVGLSLAFAGLAWINGNIFSLYLGWVVLAVLASGTTPVVWTRAITQTFVRQRGLALGLSLAGTGLAAVIGPLVLGPVIIDHGWRGGYLALAAATLVIAVPLVTIFLRDAPRNPSGQASPPGGATLEQALTTAWFWRSGLAFFLIAGGISALIVHLAPMLADSGLPPRQAAGIAGSLGLAIIAGRIGVGLLVDRFPAAYVGMLFLLLPAAACILLNRGVAIPATLLIGLAAGAEVDLLAFLTSRRFGLAAYGRIYGCQLALFSLGAGLAPILMGAAHDRFGSYGGALNIDAVVILIGAVLVGTLRRGGAPVDALRTSAA
jgi:MFS family permease